MIGISGSHTLEPGNALGFPVVERPHQVAHVGTGGAEDPFELEAGHYVRMLAVEVSIHRGRIVGFRTRRQDDRTHFDDPGNRLLLVDDSVRRTSRHALVALRANPTGQAPRRFRQHLVLRETLLHFTEARQARFGIEPRHLLARDAIIALGAKVSSDGVPFLFATFFKIAALDEAPDGDSRLFAGGDGLDDRFGAGHGVPAGENIRIIGLQGQGIDTHRPPVTQGAGTLGSEAGPVGFLADGSNNGIDLHREFRARNGHRTSPAARIGFSQRHSDTFNRLDPPVFPNDAGGRGEGHDLDAFFAAFFDLLLVGRHFLVASAVDDKRPGRTQALGAAHRIHGHVAAAHYGYPVAKGNALHPG